MNCSYLGSELMKKKIKYSTLLLTFLYFSNTAISATPNNSSVKKYKNVNSMVEDIVAISGLQQNFTIIPVPNYENALALVKNNKRIIAYDPIWLDKMSLETGNQWSSITIMAHEVGHHLNGHTLINNSQSDQLNLELDADYFAGLIVQKLGGSVKDAQQFFNMYGTTTDTLTHPSAEKRIRKIKEGWNFSCKLSNCNVVVPATKEQLKLSWTLDMLNNAKWRSGLGKGLAPIYAKAQVLLAQQNSSVGAIDGGSGMNLLKAISAFQQMNGIKPTGELDQITFEALDRDKTSDPFIQYTLTEEDILGSYSSFIPNDYDLQSKMKGLSYTRVSEMLAEKFHMDEGFLIALNPHATFRSIGEKLIVVNPRDLMVLKEPIGLVVVKKQVKQIYVFNENYKMIASYPVSIGSIDRPSPSGTKTILSITQYPIYNTSLEPLYPKKLKGFSLPAGPNSPIGTMLISFEDAVFGLHGTPNPSLISKTSTWGEVRLTNWDIVSLSKQLKRGILIEFID